MYMNGRVFQALPSTVFDRTNVLQIYLFEVAEIRPSIQPPVVVIMTLERTKAMYGPCEALL
jgi:hypothetical protein